MLQLMILCCSSQWESFVAHCLCFFLPICTTPISAWSSMDRGIRQAVFMGPQVVRYVTCCLIVVFFPIYFFQQPVYHWVRFPGSKWQIYFFIIYSSRVCRAQYYVLWRVYTQPSDFLLPWSWNLRKNNDFSGRSSSTQTSYTGLHTTPLYLLHWQSGSEPSASSARLTQYINQVRHTLTNKKAKVMVIPAWYSRC